MNEPSYLERIEILPAEVIADFRSTGRSASMPVPLQQFIRELDAVMEIRDILKFNNISAIARELRKRYPALSHRTAMTRVYDALTFFHVDDNVSNDVWDKIYADKMEDLAKLCIINNKEEIAYKCLIRAHEYRTKRESRIRPEDLQAPIFIISPNIKPEDLGYEKASLLEIARKANEGKYINMIDSLPLTDEEKKKLYLDAGIDMEEAQEVENE